MRVPLSAIKEKKARCKVAVNLHNWGRECVPCRRIYLPTPTVRASRHLFLLLYFFSLQLAQRQRRFCHFMRLRNSKNLESVRPFFIQSSWSRRFAKEVGRPASPTGYNQSRRVSSNSKQGLGFMQTSKKREQKKEKKEEFKKSKVKQVDE